MKIKNFGFSLIELIIATAVLAGLSVAFMGLMKNTQKSSVKYQFDSEITLITNEIVQVLSDPNKCLTTFGPAGTKNALSDSVTSINSKYYISSNASAPAGGYGNAGVDITSFVLSANGAEVTANTSKLVITYQNKKILKGASGAISKTKSINLYVEVNGSKNITKCVALSNSSVDIWSRSTGSSGDIFYSGGNVGIGTSTPTVPFQIVGGGTSFATALLVDSSAASGGSTIQLGNNATSGDQVRVGVNGYLRSLTAAFSVDTTGSPLTFQISNVEKMRVDTSGKVGIGTTSPNAGLEVLNTNGTRLGVTSTSDSATFLSGETTIKAGGATGSIYFQPTNGTNAVTILSSGNVGFGTTTPAYDVDVNGVVQATAFYYSSDKRLKENIGEIENAKEKLLKMKGQIFTWIKTKKRDIGFIAQEVEKIFPELVSTDKKGFKSVEYGNVSAVLVEAFKEHDKEILELKKESNDLRNEIRTLKDKIKEQSR